MAAAVRALGIVLGRSRLARLIAGARLGTAQRHEVILIIVHGMKRPVGAGADSATMLVFHLVVGDAGRDDPRIADDQKDDRRHDDKE